MDTRAFSCPVPAPCCPTGAHGAPRDYLTQYLGCPHCQGDAKQLALCGWSRGLRRIVFAYQLRADQDDSGQITKSSMLRRLYASPHLRTDCPPGSAALRGQKKHRLPLSLPLLACHGRPLSYEKRV